MGTSIFGPMPPSSEVTIHSESDLDDVLTRPSRALIEFVAGLSGPLIVLGAGGKMGPTLAVMAKRAAAAARHELRVIAVSRFSDSRARAWLEDHDVRTISCDLLNARELDKLPGGENVLYLVGLKFGTAENPASTWAINSLVPARVTERFASARIVALSTGNVYPLTEVARGGSVEGSSLTPIGEYANSAVARERIFEFCSQSDRTPIALLRLFYAVELRYGVLVDLARKVHSGEPIELVNGYFNCIWQADANEMILRALSLTATPPSVWNLCRPEILSVRNVAERLGELLGRAPQFIGSESATALLGNSARLCQALGTPGLPLETMMKWVAAWVQRGGRNLGKPTHFEVRDGKY